MKKLAILLALLALTTLAFVACNNDDPAETIGETVAETSAATGTETTPETVPANHPSLEYIAFEGLFNTEYDEDWSPVAAKKDIAELKNCTFTGYTGHLATFENASAVAGDLKLAIVDTKTGAIMKNYTKEEPDAEIVTNASVVTPANSWDSDTLFILETVTKTDFMNKDNVTYTYNLYNEQGTSILTKTTSIEKPFDIDELGNDLLTIDGKVYAYANGTLTAKFDLALREIPECDVLTAKYNYMYKNGSSRIVVFDQDYKIVADVDYSSYDNASIQILNDGNLYIYCMNTLEEDAEEYDILVDDEKCELNQYLYDIETKTATALSWDYIIQNVVNALVYEEFNDIFVTGKIENLAALYPIENKKLNEEAPLMASIGNDLTIAGQLGNYIPNQNPLDLPRLIADNRFAVTDIAGREYMIDEKGTLIGEISTAVDAPSGGFAKYLFGNDGTMYNISDLSVYMNINDKAYEHIDGVLYRNSYNETTTDDYGNIVYNRFANYYVLTAEGYVQLDLPASTKVVNYITSHGDLYEFTVTTTDETGTRTKSVFMNEVGTVVFDLVTSQAGNYEDGYYRRSIVDFATTADGYFITVQTRNWGSYIETTETTKVVYLAR